MTQPAVPTIPASVTIATFDNYPQAQAAVDLLSDKGFEVGTIRIVGHDLKSVEQVVGSMNYGKAALQGAGAGAWFGLMIGLLMAIFAPVAFLWTVLGAIVFGAIWGLVFGLISFAVGGKERSFQSVRGTTASTYTVEATQARADEAIRLLAQGR